MYQLLKPKVTASPPECPVGAFCSIGSGEPTPCSPSTVQNATAQPSCAKCPAGKYVSAEAQTACTACTPARLRTLCV